MLLFFFPLCIDVDIVCILLPTAIHRHNFVFIVIKLPGEVAAAAAMDDGVTRCTSLLICFMSITTIHNRFNESDFMERALIKV